tara:strand:- start:8034 stop:9029 length:996 start_codon:yes stop_codon:yes gene_type:complete
MNIEKEVCKQHALHIKKETGKFPISKDWSLSNGFPISLKQLNKIFEGYNNFRNYCEEPIIKRTENVTVEWIKSNCNINEKDCWLWGKGIFSNGYGQVSYNNKTCRVHKVVWELINNNVPDNLIIRHICDNRLCCNPDHLELGTLSENRIDVLERQHVKHRNNLKVSNKVRTLKTLEERLTFYLDNIDIINDCWVSNLLTPTNDNYFKVKFKGKNYMLHRLVLATKLNKPYEELTIVRHLCNNRRCINPEHLKEGTRSENALDSRSYHKGVKLTVAQVIRIKTELVGKSFLEYGSKKAFDKKWAQEYNVSASTIESIRLDRKWKDVQVNEDN